jgi:hypothetical protein
MCQGRHKARGSALAVLVALDEAGIVHLRDRPRRREAMRRRHGGFNGDGGFTRRREGRLRNRRDFDGKVCPDAGFTPARVALFVRLCQPARRWCVFRGLGCLDCPLPQTGLAESPRAIQVSLDRRDVLGCFRSGPPASSESSPSSVAIGGDQPTPRKAAGSAM